MTSELGKRIGSTHQLRAIAIGLVAAFVAVGGSDVDANTDAATDPLPPVSQGPKAMGSDSEGAGAVDDERLRAAASDAANWVTHGRDYAEQRFSPLSQVDTGNVSELRLAWSFPTGLQRGHEATPLVVDGVMYLTGSWSVVFALDAKTGKEIWRYDPQVSHEVGRKTCCDVVNRGVAVYQGRVFVGVLDGRLVALDAATGKVDWEVVTVDQQRPYTITGAPRVVKGHVVIGNGGAEFGVRGYVSAYNPENGDTVWRTYTVPGNPEQPFESAAIETAAGTWSGEWWKHTAGGGTVWDSMAYDAELDLLYVGTGNGTPWNHDVRSPGGGDNLYLSSILALDPDSGELRWHYQTTPGDHWDYTATQHIILADIDWQGQRRKVLMQAPKNGFFYVIDRTDGTLLAADAYVPVSWASGVDLESGRPVENSDARYRDGMAIVTPMYLGGHNWQPMSFNPVSGLVYIPAQVLAGPYLKDPGYTFADGEFNLAVDLRFTQLFSRESVDGFLLAWDPVAKREAWRHPHGMPWNGGTLTTAGNLVFQGTADGRFLALQADDGKLLWQSHSADSGIIAAPITYEVEGTQYVTVVSGWGGAFAQVGGDAAAAAHVESNGRVLTWALTNLSATPADIEALMAARDSETVKGAELYHVWCARCHGSNAIAGGVNPDLRDSIERLGDAFTPIVREGLGGTSMPGFGQWVDDAGIAEIERYLKSVSSGR
jgi:PQQ-dependent dehydrogenase (methanol/ethanol family)